MKIQIIAIGKIASSSPEFLLAQEYQKRINYKLEIKEIIPRPSKTLEGEEIIKLLAKNSFIICLDSLGQEFSSTQFAYKLNDLSLIYNQLIFLIGGSEGHSSGIKSQSHLLFSLGKMTFPHKIARIMLLEQIYRAQTILTNHPYHK